MNCTSVEINGKMYKVHSSGGRKTDYEFQGAYFEAPEEVILARLLHEMGLRYMHHVKFIFRKNPEDKQPAIWCPDFVVERPFKWKGEPYNGAIAVGIEVKRNDIGGKPATLSAALQREHGIRVLLLNRAHLDGFTENGGLPIEVLA